MSKPIIEIRDLGKCYRLGSTATLERTLPEAIAATVKRLFRGHPTRDTGHGTRDSRLGTLDNRHGTRDNDAFWALRDINLDVQQGEVVGIVGHNGAGKSTLLKILSRITDPTCGSATLRGRVASLLEVGTGFHPELTGRENIYLNGAVLGMRRREIAAKFDEIVAFSGVERFLDTPVKRYSSGMTVRLAFAVAAHLEPEILVIDEVLAVGDAEFQRKCLGKMHDVAQQSGRTILFVSHNMSAVNNLCHRAVLLDAGSIGNIGAPDIITSEYLNRNILRAGERIFDNQTEPNSEIIIRRVAVRGEDGGVTANLDIRRSHTLEIEYEVTKPIPSTRVGFWIATADGTIVLSSYDTDMEELIGPRVPGVYTTRCTLPGHLLNVGDYRLTLHGGMPGVRMLYILESVLAFQVHETGGAGSLFGGKRRGVVRPKLAWEVRCA